MIKMGVYANEKTYDLETNGITNVETVEMSFILTDENYSEIADSGKVTFTVQ